MFQEFYKNTIVSKYIKYLLSRTPLPLLKLIYDNETMYEGCLYIYKDKVLKCTRTGRFVGINGTLGVTDFLYSREELKVSDTTKMTVHRPKSRASIVSMSLPLSATDDFVTLNLYEPASWEIVKQYEPGSHVPGVTYMYRSKYSYYDENTHVTLGEYIRYIENLYDLNLMPLYNCFMDKWVYSFKLDKGFKEGVDPHATNKTKVTLVPIKFDKMYTIAMNCDNPVDIMPVLYNGGLIRDNSKTGYLHTELSSFKNAVNDGVSPILRVNGMRYNSPYLFSVSEDNPHIVEKERYLYLAIQVPYDFKGAISVLEGKYDYSSTLVTSDISGLHNKTPREIARTLSSNLSLLSSDTLVSAPFSDRLMEYLLRNSIDNREYIDENITKIQKLTGYSTRFPGQWTIEFQYAIFNAYMKLKNHPELNREDILGYIDKDIEDAVRKGYIQL